MTVPHGRTRLVAILATLLTAALPAIAWAQSPTPVTTSPAPSAAATQAAPSSAPASMPAGSPGASPAPGASASPTPAWTPVAVSGPITLLAAGIEGDTRAAGIEDAFRSTLAEACPQATLDVRYADSAATQADQATSAVASGSGVLVVDPVDPAAAGAIVSGAQAGGATVIALGDGVRGAVPDLQVAYDLTTTGPIVASAVVDEAVSAAQVGIDANPDASPLPSDAPVEQVVLIDGPADDAVLAAWATKVREGLGTRATVVHEAAVTELTEAEGQRVMAEAIAALGADGFGAVIAPSDAVAAGVIAGLLDAGLVPADLSVTGAGGTLPGSQAIVLGDQLLTTWDPDAPAASLAATLACAQATGIGLPAGVTTTPVDNGTGEVPTILLTGIVVTVDGSPDGTRSIEDTIIAGEAYGPDTVARICTEELAQACEDRDLVVPSPSPAASAPTGSPVASDAADASVAPSGAASSPEASRAP